MRMSNKKSCSVKGIKEVKGCFGLTILCNYWNAIDDDARGMGNPDSCSYDKECRHISHNQSSTDSTERGER